MCSDPVSLNTSRVAFLHHIKISSAPATSCLLHLLWLQIFLSVCSTGALPMAPRLASVCTNWSAAVAETPEIWKVLDTQHLSPSATAAAVAVSPAGPSSSDRRGNSGRDGNLTPPAQKRRKGRSNSSSYNSLAAARRAAGHAVVNEGLKQWALSGRLQQLQSLRLVCAGSSPLSLDDPQAFDDEHKHRSDGGERVPQ